MKKILSVIAAIAMIGTFSTTVFAASPIESVNTGVNTDSHDVLAKSAGSTTTPDVYSVDVAWGAMEFTYNVGGTRVWDADTHTYTDNSSASWTASGNTVSVTNHSNKAVTAEFSFTAIAAYSSQISGSFDKNSASLPSAVGKELTDESLKATATLTLSGSIAGSLSDFTEVGSVTVTVS